MSNENKYWYYHTDDSSDAPLLSPQLDHPLRCLNYLYGSLTENTLFPANLRLITRQGWTAGRDWIDKINRSTPWSVLVWIMWATVGPVGKNEGTRFGQPFTFCKSKWKLGQCKGKCYRQKTWYHYLLYSFTQHNAIQLCSQFMSYTGDKDAADHILQNHKPIPWSVKYRDAENSISPICTAVTLLHVPRILSICTNM